MTVQCRDLHDHHKFSFQKRQLQNEYLTIVFLEMVSLVFILHCRYIYLHSDSIVCV